VFQEEESHENSLKSKGKYPPGNGKGTFWGKTHRSLRKSKSPFQRGTPPATKPKRKYMTVV